MDFKEMEMAKQQVNQTYIPDSSKLSDGKVYKNFAELVKDMGWKKFKSGSNGEKAQQKALSTVCSWKRDLDENGNKQSNKIIIEKVYAEKKEVKDKRRANDKNYLTRLVSRRILEVIEENERLNRSEYHGFQNKLYLTLGSLYAQVGLVNSYYIEGRNRQDELSNELNCPIEHVNDFYNCVSANLKKTIQKAFDRLYNQRLVYAINTKRLILKDADADLDETSQSSGTKAELVIGDVYASEKQRLFIFNCERKVMSKYKMSHFGDVYMRDLNFRRVFFRDVVKMVQESAVKEEDLEIQLLRHLDYYYNVVELSYCEDFVRDEVRRLGQMTEEEREVLKQCVDRGVIEEYLTLGGMNAKVDVNQEHMNRLTINAKQRHQKALKKTSERDIYYKRRGESYPINIEKIAERVIENVQ